MKTYGKKVYTNFLGSNVPENRVESEPFTAMFIDSFFAYESKYNLQLYSDNCAYKIVHT